jgi:hypothetical protein
MTERMGVCAVVPRGQSGFRPQVFGMGILVDDSEVCTCAHVIDAALGLKGRRPGDSAVVSICFPRADGEPTFEGIVDPERWFPPDSAGGSDMAVIRLPEPLPATIERASFGNYSITGDNQRWLKAYGFRWKPSQDGRSWQSHPLGEYATGTIAGSLPGGRAQFDGRDSDGAVVEHGFSGAGIYDPDQDVVVGMVVDKDKTQNLAHFIDTKSLTHTLRLRAKWRPVRYAVPSFDALREAFANRYLQTVFAGRKGDLKELDDWLERADNAGPRLSLLTAPAGAGKSALVTRWVQHRRQKSSDPIIFIPISAQFNTNQQDIVLPAIAIELARVLQINPQLPSASASACQDAIAGLFIKLAQSPRDCLLVVDGVDETRLAGWNLGSRLLPAAPPPGLKILVTARPLAGDEGPAGWRDRLGWSEPAEVFELRIEKLGDRDIAKLVQDLLATAAPDAASDANLAQLVYRLTDRGDPLLVELYAAEIQDQLRDGGDSKSLVARLQARRRGLGGYFNNWMAERNAAFGASRLAETILLLLAHALGPVSHGELMELLQRLLPGVPIPAKADLLEPLSRFVLGDGKAVRYTLGHPRFAEFLRNEQYADNPALREAARTFLDWGAEEVAELRGGHRAARDVREYILDWFPRHLLNLDDPPVEKLIDLLSAEWVQAARATGRETRFTLFASAALDKFIVLINRQRFPAANLFNVALRAAIFLASIHDASKSTNSRLLGHAFEQGVIEYEELLLRLSSLEPQARVGVLLELARSTRPGLDHWAMWRQARDAACTAASSKMLGSFDALVRAAEDMQSLLPAGEAAASWAEILSLVRQSLATPPLWPNLEYTPQIYFNVFRRPLNQMADLLNVSLQAAISPSMLARATALLARKYADGPSIRDVLAIIRHDGRIGRIVGAVHAVLDLASANAEQDADGLPALLLHCGSRDDRLRVAAAALGALAVDNPSSPLIVRLLNQIEVDAGPLVIAKLADLPHPFSTVPGVPLSAELFNRAWRATADLLNYERAELRAKLLRVVPDRDQMPDLVRQQLTSLGLLDPLRNTIKAIAFQLSDEQRRIVLADLAKIEGEKDPGLAEEIIRFAPPETHEALRQEFAPLFSPPPRPSQPQNSAPILYERIAEIRHTWPRRDISDAEFMGLFELARGAVPQEHRAGLLTALIEVAPESRKRAVIEEAMKSAGMDGINDTQDGLQCIALLATGLPDADADQQQLTVLARIRMSEPQQAIAVICNLGYQLPECHRAAWSACGIETINKIPADNPMLAGIMARFVEIYGKRAPIGFVFRSLWLTARSDDQGRLSVLLALIYARTWKRLPVFWVMLQQWRSLSPATRASLICAIVARHPRALRWLRRRALPAAREVPETARRLELLVQLAHYFPQDERGPILAEAADAFLELFTRQQRHGTYSFMLSASDRMPLAGLLAVSDAPTRERIRHAIDSCDDQELKLFHQACAFPGLPADDKAALGLPLLEAVERVAQREGPSGSSNRFFSYLTVLFSYWAVPGSRYRAWVALLRVGARGPRREWLRALPRLLQPFPREYRGKASAAVIQIIQDAARLWP